MHAFSSYRGNRPTNTYTHIAQTIPQTGPITIHFKPRELTRNEDSGMPRVRDLDSSFGWMTFLTPPMTLISVE